MKRFLSLLAITCVTGSSTCSIVACGNNQGQPNPYFKIIKNLKTKGIL